MFTLLKNPFHKKVFFFSIPIILSMFTQQFYNVADTMIVGQFLGVDELAAVGNAGTIVMLFIVVSGGIELSSEIIFSRYLGKKDLQKIANGSINIIAIALTISITLVALGFLCLPTLYRWIHLPNELIPFTNAYIMTYIIGVPFIYVYDISRAIITALGDSKHCFYFVFGSSLLNIILDLLFICVFHLGVFGAALATIIAQALFMFVAFYHLYNKIKDYPGFTWRPHIDMIQVKELIHITIPSVIQQFVITCSFIFIQSMINPFGSEIISGFVAVNKVLTLSRIVVLGFTQAFSIYAAKMIVSQEFTELKKIYIFFIKLSLIYMTLIAFLFFIFPHLLCQPFFSIDNYHEGYQFFKTYLQCSIAMMFMSIFKFMNESLLRSSMNMTYFLICNLSDLFIKIIATYMLLSPLVTNAFWSGETIGKFVSFLLSFFFIYLVNKKREPQ